MAKRKAKKVDETKAEKKQAAIAKYLKSPGAESKTVKRGDKSVKKPVAPNTPGGTNNKNWREYRKALAALRRPEGIE